MPEILSVIRRTEREEWTLKHVWLFTGEGAGSRPLRFLPRTETDVGKGGGQRKSALSRATLGCEMKVVVLEGGLQLTAGGAAPETSRWQLSRGGTVGVTSVGSCAEGSVHKLWGLSHPSFFVFDRTTG